MTKREIIDHIRRLNPTADAGFLAGFSQEELLAYLRQLREVEAAYHSAARPEPVGAH